MKKIIGILLLATGLFSLSSAGSKEMKVSDLKEVNAVFMNNLASHAQSCAGGVKIVCYGYGQGCVPTGCLKIDQ